MAYWLNNFNVPLDIMNYWIQLIKTKWEPFSSNVWFDHGL